MSTRAAPPTLDSTAGPGDRPPAPARARIGRAALVAIALLAISTGALESVVTPTLPLLQDELDLSPASGALLSIVLLITGALTTPIAGKLGDRYGGKRVMVVLMSVVGIGGLTSALAPSFPVLLLGQVLQGAMVGALPLSFILVRTHLPAGESKVAIGVVSGMFVAGGMVGTLSAGPVAEALSRHWMFALPTMLVIAATALVARLVPGDARGGDGDGAGIDWYGLLLLSGLLVTLMLTLALAPQLGSQPLILLGLVALLAGFAVGWVVVERRVPAPMIDPRLLARPAVWRATVVTFVICIGTSVPVYLIPQLFAVPTDHYGFGASATQIGIFLLPGALAAALAGPLGGLGDRRFGSRAVVTVGVALMVAGLLGLAVVHSEPWHLVAAKVFVALANGLVVTAMVTTTATSVAEGETGVATSLVLVSRVLGYAVGTQVCGALLTAATPAGTDVPQESAFVIGFVIAGVVAALSLLVIRTSKESTS